MSHATQANTTLNAGSPELQLGAVASRLFLPGIFLTVVGFVIAIAAALSSTATRGLFSHAYLVAFTFYLAIALGGLFFVILHHLARAGWSVTLRRIAEGISCNLFLMAVLFVPVLVMMPSLYEWSLPGAAAHDPILAGKSNWLNPTAFFVRFVIYFAIWCGATWFFRSRSILQDTTGDENLSRSMGQVAPIAMLSFAVSLTLAMVDLVMSLNPHWFSTMIGVYFFADCAALGGMVSVTLLSLWLRINGRLGTSVTREHFHDMGKLTFTFVFFWGYIAFSQYMLIWYANMPEETQFFMPRQIGPWVGISLTLVFFHLFIPFLGLLSRHAKRNLGVLTFWLIWMLLAQLLDIFWLIMPNTYIQKIPEAVGMPAGTTLPHALKELLASNQSVYDLASNNADFMSQVSAPLTAASIALVLGLVLGMGGLFLATTAWFLRAAPLVPLKDPRLFESLAFENH